MMKCNNLHQAVVSKDIEDQITSLSSNKSCGADGTSPMFIKLKYIGNTTDYFIQCQCLLVNSLSYNKTSHNFVPGHKKGQ